MSPTPFGEHLKREREMRGVSLEEISSATRIGTRFLEALESEQWDRLPGGVFNRGFIRSVARFLGLDEDALVALYDLETRGRAGARTQSDPSALSSRNWRPVIGGLVALAIAAAVVVGGWFGYQRYGPRILAHFRAEAPARAASRAPSRMSPAAPDEPLVHGDEAENAKTSTSLSSRATSALPGDESESVPASRVKGLLTLKMEAGKPADVKVVADGKTVFSGHINADEAKSFEARSTFHVTSTESSALLLELNGQTVPPIGTPGQPGSITLTEKDLRPSEGGSH
jgi:cytoskeleton protein RodZ